MQTVIGDYEIDDDPARIDPAAAVSFLTTEAALEEQWNGEWRYLEFLQVTSLITAEIFMREIPGGMRAR